MNWEKLVGFESNEMNMPTIADGWCESIRTGALPESGNGVRSDDGVGKPPQNSSKVYGGG